MGRCVRGKQRVGPGAGGVSASGDRVSVWEGGSSDGGGARTTVQMCVMSLNWTLVRGADATFMWCVFYHNLKNHTQDSPLWPQAGQVGPQPLV